MPPRCGLRVPQWFCGGISRNHVEPFRAVWAQARAALHAGCKICYTHTAFPPEADEFPRWMGVLRYGRDMARVQCPEAAVVSGSVVCRFDAVSKNPSTTRISSRSPESSAHGFCVARASYGCSQSILSVDYTGYGWPHGARWGLPTPRTRRVEADWSRPWRWYHVSMWCHAWRYTCGAKKYALPLGRTACLHVFQHKHFYSLLCSYDRASNAHAFP